MAVRGIRKLTSVSILSECDISYQRNVRVRGTEPNLLRSQQSPVKYTNICPYISLQVQPSILLSNLRYPRPPLS